MKNVILSILAIALVMFSANAQTKKVQTKFSIDKIVTDYLALKNALIKDDSKASAKAGKTLYATFNAVKTNTIDPKLKKSYLDIAESAKENAEHIGDNAGKLDHQREHFVLLSKDINDLIKTFGTKQKLYQDYCPMADDGKGAIWISEVKEIKNPYFGSKMLTCGSIKKILSNENYHPKNSDH
jgi:isopropylmalate/homocitrate/citramalate synthase